MQGAGRAARPPETMNADLFALFLTQGLLPHLVFWFPAPQKRLKHLCFYIMELFLLTQQLSHHLQLLPQKHSDLCSLQEGWVEFDQDDEKHVYKKPSAG